MRFYPQSDGPLGRRFVDCVKKKRKLQTLALTLKAILGAVQQPLNIFAVQVDYE